MLHKKGHRYIDLVGQRFNRLLVVSDAGRANGGVLWLCKCGCGKETTVSATALKSGNTKSCGCLFAEHKSHLKHGAAKKGQKGRLYNIWQRMKQRCSDPNSSDAKYYVLAGVRVCQEWFDFAIFREWALSHGYANNLTIDRINEGNYEPSNCQWVPQKDNAIKAVKKRVERRMKEEIQAATGIPTYALK
jgi:hypothetical protein